MRCLFVSNQFPPYGRGGYEQLCEDVAQAFTARGHTIAVLTGRAPETATNGNGSTPPASAHPFAVHRVLYPELEGGLAETTLRLLRNHAPYEAENLRQTSEVLTRFAPDVVLIWGMWNISRTVPKQIEDLAGSKVVYYICDYWPSLPSAYIQRMQEPARRSSLQSMKGIVSRYFLPRLSARPAVKLAFEHPICVSKALRRILVSRGVAIAHAQVIYGSTAVEDFAEAALQPRSDDETLRLLYLGRMEPTKGVHTVIQALTELRDLPTVTLGLIGTGPEDYVAALRKSVADAGLDSRVTFLGTAKRAEVPVRMAEFDALVFSSEWEEPFARTVLEAMAAGMPVIGTTTGGTGEILVEGETGLTYLAGDGTQLALQIERLARSPELRRQLSSTALVTVRENFTFTKTVDELETALHAIAVGAPQQDLGRVAC